MIKNNTLRYILFALFTLSCGINNDQRDYDIPNLEEHIITFKNSKKCFEKALEVLVVNLELKNDTLFLEMADTYPDIKKMKFNCDTVLYQSRIIFTGERIKGYYNKSSLSQFPTDIVEINKNRDLLSLSEFNLWEFAFKDDNLLYKSTPCSERK